MSSALLAPAAAYASTPIPPDTVISTDTTWTLANSPYVLLGDVTVAAGATLTIDPGVTVKTVPDSHLSILGSLNALGTAGSGITFTRQTSSATNWSGVYFSDAAAAGSLAYVTVDHAYSGILLEQPASVAIDHATFHDDGTGVNAYCGTLTLTNSQFNANSNGAANLNSSNTCAGHYTVTGNLITANGYGMSVAGDLDVTGNTITANSQGGIEVNQGATGQVEHNLIAGNGGDGVTLHNSTVSFSYNTISSNVGYGINSIGQSSGDHNNIVGNGRYAVYQNQAPTGAPLSPGLAMSDSWWGTTDTSLIDRLIYDHADDPDYRQVSYPSPASGPVADAPADPGTWAIPSLAASDFSVDKSQAAPGETLTYTLTLRNTGLAAATGATATMPLPAGTTFVSASGFSYDNTHNRVVWTGNIAIGGTQILTTQLAIDSDVPDVTYLDVSPVWGADWSQFARTLVLGGPPIDADAASGTVTSPILVNDGEVPNAVTVQGPDAGLSFASSTVVSEADTNATALKAQLSAHYNGLVGRPAVISARLLNAPTPSGLFDVPNSHATRTVVGINTESSGGITLSKVARLKMLISTNVLTSSLRVFQWDASSAVWRSRTIATSTSSYVTVDISQTGVYAVFSTQRTSDTTPPVVSAPVANLVSQPALGTTAQVLLSWPAAMDASGISAYTLQQKKGTGSWTMVSLPSATATSVTLKLSPAKYQFRLSATDASANHNTSAFLTGTTHTLSLVQENSSSITKTGTWKRKLLTGSSAKYVMFATTAGAKADYTFSGSSIAFVTTTGPGYGMAEIWLDGVKQTTIDLYSATATKKRIAWAPPAALAQGSHTLEIRVLGTKNSHATATRVDLDALLVWN